MPARYDVSDSVAVITLDRPDVLNAFDDALGKELLARVEEASHDSDVRCIVITGEGRAFSAGEDLAPLQAQYEAGEAPPLGSTLMDRYNPLIRAIRSAPKPVIAALNGIAAGAGASIALACDFRIAHEKTKLMLAFVKVGLVPDSGALWFLTKMVGEAKALELAMTGDPIDAEEALRLGLVTKVVSLDDFESEWRMTAQNLANGPTRALALIKQLVHSASGSTLNDQLEIEVDAQTEAGSTADHLEGVRAFFQKETPRFRGH
jgi:2-(1,2-epoxy-1,2-dihydrophenyl)acetyl-CoA isomerase